MSIMSPSHAPITVKGSSTLIHCLDNHTDSLITHALTSSRIQYANMFSSVLLGTPNYVIK